MNSSHLFYMISRRRFVGGSPHTHKHCHQIPGERKKREEERKEEEGHGGFFFSLAERKDSGVGMVRGRAGLAMGGCVSRARDALRFMVWVCSFNICLLAAGGGGWEVHILGLDLLPPFSSKERRP